MRLWLAGKPRIDPGAALEELLYEKLGEAKPQAGPVVLRLRFVFKAGNPRARTPVTQPSLPALVRGHLDILCGVAWGNEKQLVVIHAAKEYGNAAGTEMSW